MRRREFIAGVGSLTAASAAVGTGAFTSVSADRSLTVETAADADAFLSMRAIPGSANADYVEIENGQFSADLSDGNDDLLGNGVNTDAVTTVGDLFRIENRGTQPVFVWLLEEGGKNGSKSHAFYAGSWSDDATAISVADFNNGLANTRARELQPQSDAGVGTAAVELGVGDHVDVGLVVDTGLVGATGQVLKENQGATIHATAEASSLASVFTPAVTPD